MDKKKLSRNKEKNDRNLNMVEIIIILEKRFKFIEILTSDLKHFK